jgi:hypothetical protein
LAGLARVDTPVVIVRLPSLQYEKLFHCVE